MGSSLNSVLLGSFAISVPYYCWDPKMTQLTELSISLNPDPKPFKSWTLNPLNPKPHNHKKLCGWGFDVHLCTRIQSRWGDVVRSFQNPKCPIPFQTHIRLLSAARHRLSAFRFCILLLLAQNPLIIRASIASSIPRSGGSTLSTVSWSHWSPAAPKAQNPIQSP